VREEVVGSLSALVTSLTLLAVAPIAVSGAVPTSCASKSSALADGTLDEQLGVDINALYAAGLSQDQVEVAIDKQWCLMRVGRAPSGPEPLSVNTDATFATPSLFYDSQLHHYYAAGYYHWVNDNFYSDGSGDIGGYDGAGLRLAGGAIEQYPEGQSFSYSDNPAVTSCSGHFGSGYTNHPQDVNEYGVGFKVQDEAAGFLCNGSFKHDLNMYAGTVVDTFAGLLNGPCKTLQVYADYSHSWQTTSLTGFRISQTGFGVSWANAGHEWSLSKAGQTGHRLLMGLPAMQTDIVSNEPARRINWRLVGSLVGAAILLSVGAIIADRRIESLPPIFSGSFSLRNYVGADPELLDIWTRQDQDRSSQPVPEFNYAVVHISWSESRRLARNCAWSAFVFRPLEWSQAVGLSGSSSAAERAAEQYLGVAPPPSGLPDGTVFGRPSDGVDSLDAIYMVTEPSPNADVRVGLVASCGETPEGGKWLDQQAG
jgi:hypothetical protein